MIILQNYKAENNSCMSSSHCFVCYNKANSQAQPFVLLYLSWLSSTLSSATNITTVASYFDNINKNHLVVLIVWPYVNKIPIDKTSPKIASNLVNVTSETSNSTWEWWLAIDCRNVWFDWFVAKLEGNLHCISIWVDQLTLCK